ncbi:hypothetical protein PBI_SCTP2_32 [Salicola phage SCTP-2]|nr:hypothetical protein PBI_SCTP2_32 [Salicola phage SCTP-2]
MNKIHPEEKNVLWLIFWDGFNDAKKYHCKWEPYWQQHHIDAYMEGQEKMIRHILEIPMVRFDEV